MTIQTKTLGLAGLIALAASPALAQEASPDVPGHSVFVFNTLLFLIGGFLVMWMAAGFCMLEAGLVRSKNVAMQCTKNIALFSIAAVGYYAIGFNLMYPGDGWSMEGYLGAFGLTSLEPVGVAAADVGDIEYASVGSDFFFQ
ncbi:MAG: ammonium transporter, partial [Pseudomonadota bacterium]